MSLNFTSWLQRVEDEVMDVSGQMFYADENEEDLLHGFFREGKSPEAAAQLLLLYRELGEVAVAGRREVTA